MKKIWLDFKQPVSPSRRVLRIFLLLTGIASVTVAILLQREVEAEASALNWQKQSLSQLETRRLPRLQTPTDGTASQDASKHANQVLRQLNLPWDRLFNALEQSVAAEVSVLAIAPDAERSIITIKASATNMDAIVDFMERLRATNLLKGVHLLTQESSNEDGDYPLQFTLQASWEATP
jgi:Tfp pilus assembly protein PilN